MFRIGMIGVESKHAAFFGEIINLRNIYEGYAVTSVWGGDAPEKLPGLQKKLGISEAYETYEELIDASDAVMVIQRRGSEHFLPAKMAIEAGKPVFVDKPFTSCSDEAQVLTAHAKVKGVAVMGGTTLKFLPQVEEARELVAKEKPDTVFIRYYADAQSEYDGFNFYGSHLVELCVRICGEGYSHVKAIANKDGVLAGVSYPNIKGVINSSPHFYGLDISLLGKTTHHFNIDETECYRCGMDAFIGMLKSGEPPIGYSYYTASVKLTTDIIKSMKRQ